MTSPIAAGANARPKRLGPPAFAIAAILLTALAAGQAAQLHAFYLAQDRLPQWDMAGHAWGGIELHQALAHGHPLRFLALLNAQDKWPFGFSLLLLPFVWIGGDGFAAATLLSLALFALMPLLIVWAAREVDAGPVGWWSGVLASLLFLASPLLRVFAVLIMREEAGVFFSLAAFCCYLRARRRSDGAAWRLAGLAGLALFLIKYNYALILGVALAANELLRQSPARRTALWRFGARWLWPWRQGSRSAKAIAVLVYLVALCMLLKVNVGYAIYAALVVATVVLARRARRDPAGLRAAWRDLPVAVRAVVATLILPLWIWFLSPWPVHPKEILAFLRNRDTGPPLASPASILYYPRAFVHDYAPAGLGVAVLALFALAVLGWIIHRSLRRDAPWGVSEAERTAQRAPTAGAGAPLPPGRRPTGRLYVGEPERALLLAAAVSVLLPTLHPYKEPRFLATAVPFVLLAAAWFASRLAHAVPLPRLHAVLGAVVCAALAAGIVERARAADLPARLARDYSLYSADPAYRQPLDFAAAAGQGAERLAVLGSFNELSENLIRCRLAQAGGPGVVRPLGRFRADLPPAAVRKELRGWLHDERPDRIVALRPLPGSPLMESSDYRTYNAWQLAAISGLETDAGLKVTARQAFPATRLEVLTFTPVPR
jgi:hypothetical protein